MNNNFLTLNNNDLEFFKNCINSIIKETNFLEMNNYIQHGNTTCLWHCIAVAYYSYCFAKKHNIKCNEKSLLYGALLHDYFLYDWHENDKSHRLHGFTHGKTALNNALKHYSLNKIERNIIKNHMFPLTIFPPFYKESVIVCIADKICSTYETFNKDIYINLKKSLPNIK